LTRLYLFLSFSIWLNAEMSIDTSGLIDGMNKTKQNAYNLLERERKEAIRRAAEYARTHPNIQNSTSNVINKETTKNTVTVNSSTSSKTKKGVKKVYIGSREGGYPHYVIECNDGRSFSDINKRNGVWHHGVFASNMGYDYKNLSINDVANKKCS